MNFDKLDRWVSVAANIGVLIGIIFLVLEIRTNTESNILGVQEAYSSNFIQINTLATSPEIAGLLLKSRSGDTLTPVEDMQLDAYFRLFLTQTNFIRRLYDRGVVSEIELIEAYEGVRRLIQQDENIRRRTEQLSTIYRQLLLEDDGIEQYMQSVR